MCGKVSTKRNRLFREEDQKFHTKFSKAVKITYAQFFANTRLCGIWLLNKRYNKGKSRLFWAFLLLLLLGMSCYLTLLQWINFYNYPIVTSISKRLSITQIPFPALTLCSSEFHNENLQLNFLNSLKMLPKYNQSQVKVGIPLLLSYLKTGMRKNTNVNISLEGGPLQELLIYNNISISKAITSILPTCQHLIKYIFLGKTSIPINAETITTIKTFYGTCCLFNGDYKRRKSVAFSNLFGLQGALSIIGHNPFNAINVFIHHPYDVLLNPSKGVYLNKNVVSFLSITSESTLVSDDVLRLPATKRRCFDPSDVGISKYRNTLCLMICQRFTFQKECGCTPYHLNLEEFTLFRECNINDLLCFYKIIEGFDENSCLQCQTNCLDITYYADYFSVEAPFELPYFMKLTHSELKDINMSEYFLSHFYFRKQTFRALSKVSAITLIPLLSNLGGIFNLCLGLSLISVIEIFYFGTWRLFFNYRAQR